MTLKSHEDCREIYGKKEEEKKKKQIVFIGRKISSLLSPSRKISPIGFLWMYVHVRAARASIIQ